MSFLSPKMPAAPAPPPPPPNPATFGDPAVQGGGSAATRAAAAAAGAGLSDTVKTSAQGAAAPATATKALLGT